MNNINTNILVDYLDDNLSEAEKNNVTNMLHQDAAIQQELDNLLLTKSAIKYYGIKQQVASIAAEMQNAKPIKTEKSKVVKMLKWSLGIAASLLVIAVGIGAYKYSNTTSDKLFAANYKAYNLNVSRNASVTTSMENAFNEKKYSEVLLSFSATKEPTQKELFLAGQANMETNNFAEAETCFYNLLQKNTADQKVIFNDDAEYYLAMSYLKNNKIESAMPLFEAIHNNNNHLYNDKVNNDFMRSLKILKWKQ
jgi:tetratricopeptide (TPR) repeat protein